MIRKISIKKGDLKAIDERHYEDGEGNIIIEFDTKFEFDTFITFCKQTEMDYKVI